MSEPLLTEQISQILRNKSRVFRNKQLESMKTKKFYLLSARRSKSILKEDLRGTFTDFVGYSEAKNQNIKKLIKKDEISFKKKS